MNFEKILSGARKLGASDVHLVQGISPAVRIGGEIRVVEGVPLGQEMLWTIHDTLLNDHQKEEFKREWQVCFSRRIEGIGRFRISVYSHAGCPEFSIRLCESTVRSAEDLGLPEAIDELTRLPGGLVLVTGPTGMGKTTTLNYLINVINESRRAKIITIEDPVEYEMESIGQIQVHSEIGLTFAGGLRAMLRHDPDVIMVGEIRDQETAEVAIQAALTGHMVFSTLHTNTAIGAIERLQDLGAEPFLIKASLRGVLGQRLLRRLCSNCSQPLQDPSMISLARKRLQAEGLDAGSSDFRQAAGCEHCSHSGYSGRVGVFELLNTHALVAKYPERDLSDLMDERTLRAHGYIGMVTDGIEKASRGMTSLDEIERVFGRWYG